MTCRIGLFLMNDGDYQELLWDDCLETARRYDLPVRAFWAENDSQKQIKQIQACLSEPEDQRPTVVMVSPVREIALISTAHAATSLGIGWVVLLRWSDYLTDMRQEFPTLPIFSVMTDQHDIGRIQGRQVKALLPQGGTLVYIRGPLGTSSAMRRFVGLQEILQGSPIELFPVNGDWTMASGTRAMKNWLRTFQGRELPKFMVAAQNDAMAMGAKKALEEFTRAQPSFSADAIRVCGCDGTPGYGRRLVTEGKLTSTVIMPPCSGRAVSEIAAILGGGPRPTAQIVVPPLPFPEPHVLAGLAA
jgi:ribose transport system substrate-binding protein